MGVEKNIDSEGLKKHYKRKSLKLHPDGCTCLQYEKSRRELAYAKFVNAYEVVEKYLKKYKKPPWSYKDRNIFNDDIHDFLNNLKRIFRNGII